MHIYPVIIAGGSGTRFWPVSRKSKPKQFLDLFSGRPLITDTFERVLPITTADSIYVVAGKDYKEDCLQALPDLKPENLLLEPSGKNTAPAIALAASVIYKRDPHAIMAVLPADHFVAQPDKLNEALHLASKIALEQFIVTIGIQPTNPETGFGYIRAASQIQTLSAYHVHSFREKPSYEVALEYLQAGNYYWNAGIFIMQVETFLNELKMQLPNTYKVSTQLTEVTDTEEFEAMLQELWPDVDAISVDYGIMEKAKKMGVVPADCGWSDVGSWPALRTIKPKDNDGNVLLGNSLAIEASDCIIHSSSDHFIAAVGVHDLVVVGTPEATLVLPKKQAQRVREVISYLKKHNPQLL